MDEDENVLLPETDNESLSENEDPPDDKQTENRDKQIFVEHTKLEFVIIKFLLIISTTLVLILLPLYIDTVNLRGNVYSLILTNNFLVSVFLLVIMLMLKRFFSKYKQINLTVLPIRLPKLCQVVLLYYVCAFMIVYAIDRKRVVCHLQDPVKGLMLVWSLLFYFCFSQRFMCLQRIFSTTLVIVGWFIAVDYSMCNEFRCRGYDRQRVSDETGHWTWGIHAIWTTVYIAGLGICAAYFTVLEHAVFSPFKEETSSMSSSNNSSLPVSTIGTSAFRRNEPTETHLPQRLSVIHLAMWIHILGLIIVIALFWTDFIPQIGKGSSASTFLNYTLNDIRCHFESSGSVCGNLPIISWLFFFSYLVMILTSMRFLILTQSAVYTVATMTVALPMVEIWWSLFHLTPDVNGGLYLIWHPSFSGEVISAILGLGVMMVGMFFLFKSHFKRNQWYRIATNCLSSSPNA